MTTTATLSYVLAAVGLALAISAAIAVMRRHISYAMANTVLLKLATTGAVPRIIKLAAAAPGASYLEAVKRAVLAGAAAHSRDRVVLEAAIGPAYEAAGKEHAAQWKRLVDRGLFGALVVGGGAGLAMTEEPLPVPLAVAAGIAVLGVLLVITRRSAFDAALASGRATLLPAIVQAYLDGPGAEAPPATRPIVTDRALTFAISREDTLERTVTLDEAVIKIGNHARSTLRLEDPAVSRMHAVVELTDDRATIIDLGSSVGTFVNGTKINKAALAHGDTLKIGPFHIAVTRGATQHDPFRTAPPVVATEPATVAHAPSLRDGVCPICRHETVRTITRTDTRFAVLVCAACGYTQEFADVARLDEA